MEGFSDLKNTELTLRFLLSVFILDYTVDLEKIKEMDMTQGCGSGGRAISEAKEDAAA